MSEYLINTLYPSLDHPDFLPGCRRSEMRQLLRWLCAIKDEVLDLAAQLVPS